MSPAHPSATTLGDFKRLPTTATLLLFTPVVVPLGYLIKHEIDAEAVNRTGTNAATADLDPFELLGRALSRSHRRIRHVPYVPSVGFTETHEVFLKEADAIIVVTCTPAEPTDVPASSPRSTTSVSISNQADFVDHAVDALEDVERNVPILNLHFGDDDDNNDVAQKDIGTRSSKHLCLGQKFDRTGANFAAELLFGGAR